MLAERITLEDTQPQEDGMPEDCHTSLLRVQRILWLLETLRQLLAL